MSNTRLIDTPYGKMSFYELSKRTGIDHQSLRHRHRRGKRGQELIKPVEKRKSVKLKKEEAVFKLFPTREMIEFGLKRVG